MWLILYNQTLLRKHHDEDQRYPGLIKVTKSNSQPREILLRARTMSEWILIFKTKDNL